MLILVLEDTDSLNDITSSDDPQDVLSDDDSHYFFYDADSAVYLEISLYGYPFNKIVKWIFLSQRSQ